MQFLEKLDSFVNRSLAWVAGIALIAMMLFTVADMVSRGLGRPLAGSYEVIGWLSAAAMAMSLGYTQMHKGHVAIDLVVERLPTRVRATVDLLMSLMSLLLFVAVAWYVARYGLVLHATGSLSETLKTIVYPWVYVVAAGCAGLALALLVDFLRSAQRLLSAGRPPIAPAPVES